MWRRRIARRMPWIRVPLRRGSDKVQAWLTLTVVVVTLMVAPWVAWWVGTTTYLAEVRASAWERQHYRPVAAVLLEDAPGSSQDGGEPPPALESAPVPARWTGPDGKVGTGAISVPVATPAGTVVTAWVDERGSPVLPPRRRNATKDATAAATLAVAAVTTVLAGVRRLVIWHLDRRRLRSWEAEWLIVGPRWSRR